LAKHGWSKFINWYDDRSWYPLGRPVGTTIYPGIQVSSVFIHDVLNKYIGYKMSLNDVCVYVPAWFSVLACLALFGLTTEVAKSANAGVRCLCVLPGCLFGHTASSPRFFHLTGCS
jgi:dolichyl-diphosphooligosaccharide--protein glycosyltransferase